MAKKTVEPKTRMMKNKGKITVDPIVELELYKHVAEGTKNVFYKYSSIHGNLAISSNSKSILGFSPKQLKENTQLWSKSIHQADSKLVFKQKLGLFLG